MTNPAKDSCLRESFSISNFEPRLDNVVISFLKFVKFGDNEGCMFDYVRIPGGSEDGSVHTSRDR
jgi:hypothetical protein